MNYILYVHDTGEEPVFASLGEVQSEIGELIRDYTMQRVTVDIEPDQPDTPLGIPYMEVGQLAQAFGQCLVDRGYDRERIKDLLRNEFIEDRWWDIAGDWVDHFAHWFGLDAFPEEDA